MTATLAPTESGFRATWRASGRGAEHALAIALASGPDELNVTLFDQDRATRRRAAFKALPASAVIVGEGSDRVRITFLDGEGKPFQAVVSTAVRAGRAVLRVDRGDREVVACDFQTSFEAEQKSAQDLMARATEALRNGKDGEAIRAYEEILARFPFEESIERQASQAKERATTEASKRARDLAARVDDAIFFRTARRDDVLCAEIEAHAARYAGTELETSFRKELERLTGERGATAKEKNDAEAAAAFARAQDYLEVKHGPRRAAAAAFFEVVVRRYPDTDWAKQAEALLERLKAEELQERAKLRDGK